LLADEVGELCQRLKMPSEWLQIHFTPPEMHFVPPEIGNEA